MRRSADYHWVGATNRRYASRDICALPQCDWSRGAAIDPFVQRRHGDILAVERLAGAPMAAPQRRMTSIWPRPSATKITSLPDQIAPWEDNSRWRSPNDASSSNTWGTPAAF